MNKLPKFWVGFLGILLFIDLIFLNLKIITETRVKVSNLQSQEDFQSNLSDSLPEEFSNKDLPRQSSLPVQAGCPEECLKIFAQKTARAISTLSAQSHDQDKVEVEQKKVPTVEPRTYYLPLGNGGSTISTQWTDVSGSGFIFNLADYRSEAQVFWQANLKAYHPGSRCYARIWDITHSRAVDYSEQTTDQTDYQTLTSLPLSIWQGKNNYILQIKSLEGVACFLESPRLIIND